MKTLTRNSITLLTYALTVLAAQASVVTLQVHTFADGGPIITNSEITIASNQVAEVKARYSIYGIPALGVWIKDGVTNAFALNDTLTVGNGSGTYGIASATPVVIAGPAIFRLTSAPGDEASAYVTLKIEPESFPAGSTLVVPSGSGAIIYLEASPDLVTWTNSCGPLSYTNQVGNLFFRIRADRLP
jgi:hypothetical protein